MASGMPSRAGSSLFRSASSSSWWGRAASARSRKSAFEASTVSGASRWPGLQERPDEVGQGFDELFAVVEHEEGARGRHGPCEGGAGVLAGPGALVHRAEHPLREAPGRIGPVRTGPGPGRLSGPRGERRHGEDPHHREERARGHLLGEARLADSARTRDRHETAARHRVGDRAHIGFTSLERPGARPQPLPHGVLRGQGRLVGRPEQGARDGPALVEQAPMALVALQRSGGGAGPGLAAHEGRQERLVAGELRRELAQEGRGLPVAAEGVEAEGPGAEAVRQGGARPGEHGPARRADVVPAVGDRGQGSCERHRGRRVPRLERGDGPPGPRQQTGLVDVVRGQGERVARAASCHRVGAEQGPGARDDGLQRLVRVSGRDVGPQLLDELVLAHGGALGQGEGVDERRSAPGERAPVAGGRLVEQTKTRRPAGRGRPGGRAGLHH